MTRLAFKPDPMGERRDPFRVFLFGVAFLNGVSFLFKTAPSSAIEASFPHKYVVIYGALLALGSGCVLVGMFWQGFARDGLLIKRVGFVALAFVTAIYAIAVVIHTDDRTGVSLIASVVVAFSLICVQQVVRINRRVKFLMMGNVR